MKSFTPLSVAIITYNEINIILFKKFSVAHAVTDKIWIASGLIKVL